MGIFTRFRDIVSSNINSMLDRAEDPEKMIKMMVREMEDTLVELKSSCAGVIAERKKLERKLEEITSSVSLWSDRANLAVSKGRDDLAREALIEKRRLAELAESITAEISDHGGLIDQYQGDIRELETKLTSAKEKRECSYNDINAPMGENVLSRIFGGWTVSRPWLALKDLRDELITWKLKLTWSISVSNRLLMKNLKISTPMMR